eukprot:1143789-Pelagomonas_calceolata.AAC.1
MQMLRVPEQLCMEDEATNAAPAWGARIRDKESEDCIFQCMCAMYELLFAAPEMRPQTLYPPGELEEFNIAPEGLNERSKQQACRQECSVRAGRHIDTSAWCGKRVLRTGVLSVRKSVGRIAQCEEEC